LKLNGIDAGLFRRFNDSDSLVKILMMVGGQFRDYVYGMAWTNGLTVYFNVITHSSIKSR
jgi:hypothetical protein